MYLNKLIIVFQRPALVYHQSIRSIRGGVTIPVKIVKPNLSPNQKEMIKDRKYDKQHRNRLGRHFPGSGNMLGMYQSRYGDTDRDIDIEDFQSEMDMSTDEPNLIAREKFNENMKEAGKKSYHTVKKKHFDFSSKLPNMLTYIEKQEMKNLHKEDPITWDYIKLSESFPATPEIAKKVVKSCFKAYTVEQVLRHDKVVKRNWELFKGGQLNVDDHLHEHYCKFMDRLNFEINKEEIEKYLPSPPNFESQIRVQEFGQLFRTFEEKFDGKKKTEDKVHTDSQGRITYEGSAKDVKVFRGKSNLNQQHFTLDALREQINKKPKSEVSEVDKIIADPESVSKTLPLALQSGSNSLPVSKQPKSNYLNEIDYLGNTGVIDKENDKRFTSNVRNYPLRVNIPEKMLGLNKIYRIKDCFYDQDGYFMYRVPGLYGEEYSY